MLSDQSIVRDGPYSLQRRILLAIRKRTAALFRPRLNAILQQKLGDTKFSIFSNNCLAGVFYHDAGQQFTSPTVNLAIDGEDFIRFLELPKKYMECPMEFISWPGHNYPIARIRDIEVRFVHFKSEKEAEEKWNQRAKRIVWENMYIVATDHDGMNKPELMERFDKLPYPNKIMFVAGEYPQYPWAITVPQFKGRHQVRIMTAFANFRGQRYYETCFDLADWICRNSK